MVQNHPQDGVRRSAGIGGGGLGLLIFVIDKLTGGTFPRPHLYCGLLIALIMIGWSLPPIIRGITDHARQRNRMLPFIGMIASGIFFLAFGGWYFWPHKAAPSPPENPLPTKLIAAVPSKPPAAPPTHPIIAPHHPEPPAPLAPSLHDGPKTIRDISNKALIEQLVDTSHKIAQLTFEYNQEYRAIQDDYSANLSHNPIQNQQDIENFKKAGSKEQALTGAFAAKYSQTIRPTEIMLREEVARRIFIDENNIPGSCRELKSVDKFEGGFTISTATFQSRSSCLLSLAKLIENGPE